MFYLELSLDTRADRSMILLREIHQKFVSPLYAPVRSGVQLGTYPSNCAIRTRKPLFPRLRNLKVSDLWTSSNSGLSVLAAIMPPTIEYIKFHGLIQRDFGRLNKCMQLLSTRFSGIKQLGIEAQVDEGPQVEEPLDLSSVRSFECIVLTLGTLNALTMVEISPHWVTAGVFHVLMFLPLLTDLDIETGAVSGSNSCEDIDETLNPDSTSSIRGKDQRYRGDDFRNLTGLMLYGQWRTLIKVFRYTFPVNHRLEVLILSMLSESSVQDSVVLAQLVRQKFPALEMFDAEHGSVIARGPALGFFEGRSSGTRPSPLSGGAMPPDYGRAGQTFRELAKYPMSLLD